MKWFKWYSKQHSRPLVRMGTNGRTDKNNRWTDDQMMAIIFTVISFLVIVSHGIGKPRSLYIHIPFCRRRCFYCNFPVQIIGERVATIEKQSALYTDILIADMRNTLNLSSWNFKDDAPLDTIYFGGGTPSMLTDECL